MRYLGLLVGFLAGCGGPHPLPADLYGLWANEDDTGLVRAFDFADADDAPELVGLADVYHLYSYAAGTAPVEVQRGSFVIAKGDGWELVTTDLWDDQGLYVGQSFGNPIRGFDGETLTLEVSDGDREYASVAALP